MADTNFVKRSSRMGISTSTEELLKKVEPGVTIIYAVPNYYPTIPALGESVEICKDPCWKGGCN